MNIKKELNICIAGLGNVGSNFALSLINNRQQMFNKTNINFNILGISAKNKDKKRIFNTKNYRWYDNALDLVDIPNCDVLIELIGSEKGLSFELIKKSLEKKIHVISANKALLSKNGLELFKIAEENGALLLFEAAVAGGIPIIKLIKQSVFLNKINKISGILNGTTNFILSEMEKRNLNFQEILLKAQKSGFAESDPASDIEGMDSAHKLSLLSTLCFGSKINYNNVSYKGISNIDIEDIKNAKKLGYRIKLISESEIIENKILSIVEPKLVRKETRLAKVEGVLNAIKIETNHLNNLIIEGDGAGGKATTSSIISDLYEVACHSSSSPSFSLGYSIKKLIDFEVLDFSKKSSSFYLRILSKDIPGVLAKITSNLNEQGISIETILQIPDIDNSDNQIPIIIVTHETTKNFLNKALVNIEKLEFVFSPITVITIDKSFE